LHGVVGFAERTENAVGYSSQMTSVFFELLRQPLVGHGPLYVSTLCMDLTNPLWPV
jgi:hypothetical protein